MDSILPFARGETRFGGDSALCSNSVDKHLEGMRFRVPNNVLPASPVTGREVDGQLIELVILRNRHPTQRFRRAEAVFQSATQVDVGGLQQMWSHTNAASGGAGVVVDDYYSSSIAPGDLFYGVLSGPCQVKTSRVGKAITAKKVVTLDQRGRLWPVTTTATWHQLGQIDRGVSANVTSQEVLVNIGPQFKRGHN